MTMGTTTTSHSDPIIDPETGEIIDQSMTETGFNGLASIADTLRRMNNALKHMERRRDEAISVLRARIEQAELSHNNKTKGISERIAYLSMVAQELFRQTESGRRLVDYPGIGRFRFRKMPDRVFTDIFDKMDNQQKLEIANANPGLVKAEVNFKPVKAEIKKAQDIPPCFTLVKGEDIFEFIAEETGESDAGR